MNIPLSCKCSHKTINRKVEFSQSSYRFDKFLWNDFRLKKLKLKRLDAELDSARRFLRLLVRVETSPTDY